VTQFSGIVFICFQSLQACELFTKQSLYMAEKYIKYWLNVNFTEIFWLQMLNIERS